MITHSNSVKDKRSPVDSRDIRSGHLTFRPIALDILRDPRTYGPNWDAILDAFLHRTNEPTLLVADIAEFITTSPCFVWHTEYSAKTLHWLINAVEQHGMFTRESIQEKLITKIAEEGLITKFADITRSIANREPNERDIRLLTEAESMRPKRPHLKGEMYQDMIRHLTRELKLSHQSSDS